MHVNSRRQFLVFVGRLVIAGGTVTVLDACGLIPSSAAGSPTKIPSPAPGSPTNNPPIPGVGAGQGAPPPPPATPGQVAITPNADFYTVAFRSERPDTPSDWKLLIDGNVEQTLSLTLDELKAMPVVEEMRTLECISNPAGGPLISNANWKGLHFKDLLAKAGIKAGTTELKFESYDGYTTAIPVALAMQEHSLLAYEMNGEPLPLEHGKPLRCLWPGRYGMKQPKWLTHITAITNEYLGFWEQQGWTNDAFIRPNSRIDAPADNGTVNGSELVAQGIGFAGDSGIAKIELSIDNGKSWSETELIRGPSAFVWTQWSWRAPLPPDGEYTMLARVTDNKGATQGRSANSFLGSTFPIGTIDIQPVVVTVRKG